MEAKRQGPLLASPPGTGWSPQHRRGPPQFSWDLPSKLQPAGAADPVLGRAKAATTFASSRCPDGDGDWEGVGEGLGGQELMPRLGFAPSPALGDVSHPGRTGSGLRS